MEKPNRVITPVSERFEELTKQATELRKQGHAVALYSVWDSMDQLVSVDMAHYRTCVACAKSREQ